MSSHMLTCSSLVSINNVAYLQSFLLNPEMAITNKEIRNINSICMHAAFC